MNRNLLPDLLAENLYAVPLDALWQRGIRCLVLDLDNTLMPWNAREYDEKLPAWLENARQMGFALFMLSNGTGPRVQEMAGRLGLGCIANACKPRASGFETAARRAGVPCERCAAIGDQIFTDILGANRAGFYSILVEPLSSREFLFTKFTRLVERPIRRRVRNRVKV